MTEQKVGVRLDLDARELLKGLDDASKAWRKYVNALSRVYPTQESVGKALENTTDRLKELKHSTTELTIAQEVEREGLHKLADGLRDVQKIYKEQAARAADYARAQAEAAKRAASEINRAWAAREKAAKATARAEEEGARKVAAANKEAARQAKASADEADRAAVKKARAADQATRAQGRYNNSLKAGAKKLLLWAVGAASAYRMFMKIRRALQETFKEIYENTEEYKRLAAATDKVKVSLITVLGTESDILRFLDSAATFANNLADGFAELMATAHGLATFMDVMRETGNVTLAAAAALQKQSDVLETYQANVLKATDDTEDFSKAIDKLVSIAQRWAEAQDEFNERQRKAGTEHWAHMADIRDTYFDKIRDADEKYQDAITDANAKAAKAREKAWAKYYSRVKQIQKRAQRDIQKLIDQHNLRQKHAKQSYDLSMLQSERLYQYQRGMLVAEGDVLAIEDLDARYELEKQAREENYELQRQQAEAMFQLQLKYQKEANRDLIVALRASLQEQLAEIEAARRERIAEAEDEHAEDKADADKWRVEEMADEDERHAKQLEANAKYLEDMRKQTAKSLADLGIEWGLSADQITAIVTEVMGPDGELDRLIRQAMSNQETYAAQFRDAWVSAIDAATEALSRWSGAMSAAGGGSGGYGGGRGYSTRGRQYGGEDIVSTPTWFMVGEAGPERVSVQPLSPIGGALSLGWSGGPIPVHGSGEFSNADLSGIGDAIAQGIVLTMRDQVLSYRGQRGY